MWVLLTKWVTLKSLLLTFVLVELVVAVINKGVVDLSVGGAVRDRGRERIFGAAEEGPLLVVVVAKLFHVSCGCGHAVAVKASRLPENGARTPIGN